MNRPTIIITGASHGIGAAAAIIAAEKGAQVVLTARNREELERVAHKITLRDGATRVVDGDISRYDVCQEIVIQTVQAFGRIDAVINNAAMIGPLDLVADIPPEEWKRTLEVNLFGPVQLCMEAIPHLRQANGRVINMSSTAAVMAIPGGSAYCTAKAALNHFSKVISIEEPAITTVIYNPGDVNTPMQAEIRAKGGIKPFEEVYHYLVDAYEQGQLLPPENPALGAVALALIAPHEWTGEFIQYEEERMQNLIRALLA
jgi:NAD(P)-dependent dehydrogenase (short-subunit alcohol dehydrogenase family)